MSYLINCEYFYNLNEDEDMTETGIMVGICNVHPHTYLHTQLKKSGILHTHTHPSQEFPVKTGTSLFVISSA